MAKYTVSLALDCRVDVTVEASSFKEAFEKARNVCYESRQVEVVGSRPVNATDENGNMEDYNG